MQGFEAKIVRAVEDFYHLAPITAESKTCQGYHLYDKLNPN